MQRTYLKLSLLAVLVAGATMIISCEKEATKTDSIMQLKSQSLDENDDDCSIKPDIPGVYNPGESCYCDAGLITHCNYKKPGNCFKPVIIKPGAGLDELVLDGPDAVAKFFSGETWKVYWSNIDDETIEKLVSGEYYFHKMYRSENSSFYAASKSKVINADAEYLIVLPVITSEE